MNFTQDFYDQSQACIEKIARDYRPKLMAAHGKIITEAKPDSSIVTEMDKELETLLKEGLSKFDSGIGFEGEEYGKEGNSETFWLIDPIDGTESFVRGLQSFANIVTLISADEPVFTFVYKVPTDELFIASKNGGATKNGVSIQVSDRPLNRSWVEITSSKIGNKDVVKVVQALEEIAYRSRITDDFTLVVDGRLDGNVIYKTDGGAWDYAPRALLAREAGGRVANIGSDSYDYRNFDFVAANPVIFDDMMRVINEAVTKT